MTKNDNAVEENPGIGVFSEIKESEKNAEQIIEKSKRDAEEIMNSAKSKASSMILDRFEEIENEKIFFTIFTSILLTTFLHC